MTMKEGDPQEEFFVVQAKRKFFNSRRGKEQTKILARFEGTDLSELPTKVTAFVARYKGAEKTDNKLKRIDALIAKKQAERDALAKKAEEEADPKVEQ